MWENVRTWWAAKDRPNVKLVHFAALKTDLRGEMRAIADFLGCEISQDRWPDVIKHCSFDYMKDTAENVAPLGGAVFDGGARTFMNKGVNGRWRDVLTPEDSAAYEARAVAELGPECALWLATGKIP